MDEFKITWFEKHRLVLIVWDDASNVATWCDRDDIEKHWAKSPHRCENIGYLIGEDEDGYYVAARAGMFNEEEDAWGLVARIPNATLREIIHLIRRDVITIESDTEKLYEAALSGMKQYSDQLKEEDDNGR